MSAVQMTNCRQEPAALVYREGHLLSRSGLRWPDLNGAGQGPGRVCGSVGVPPNISQLGFPEFQEGTRCARPKQLFELQQNIRTLVQFNCSRVPGIGTKRQCCV